MKKNTIKKTTLGMTAAALAVAMSMSAFAATQTSANTSRMAPPAFGTESTMNQGQMQNGQRPEGQMGRPEFRTEQK